MEPTQVYSVSDFQAVCNQIMETAFSGVIVEVLEDRIIVELNPDKVRISIEKWAVAGIDERDIY